jgi:hypothetical protein
VLCRRANVASQCGLPIWPLCGRPNVTLHGRASTGAATSTSGLVLPLLAHTAVMIAAVGAGAVSAGIPLLVLVALLAQTCEAAGLPRILLGQIWPCCRVALAAPCRVRHHVDQHAMLGR